MKAAADKHTILYVDDESENLTGFKFLFRRHYHVLLANSADEAMEIIQRQEVHLLLADHRMPKMTGSALLAKVAETHPEIVRIIVTGYSDIEGIIEAVNKGRIYYYVTKPWNADELKVIIDRALESFQLRFDNKNLIQNLTQTNKELDTFLYRSSHDLRRPITTIMGLTQVARMSLLEKESLKLFDKIEDTAVGMNKMLHKLYMVADIYAIDEEAHELIDLNQLIAEVFAELKELAKERKVSLRKKHASCAVPFHSNMLFVRNILFNLVENGIIFHSRKHGAERFVEVSFWEQHGQYHIDVSDNGMGIGAQYLPKIYNMYFVASEETVGNGLGLYVVKKSVEMLHGHIEIATALDEGTTFSLSLPPLPQ